MCIMKAEKCNLQYLLFVLFRMKSLIYIISVPPIFSQLFPLSLPCQFPCDKKTQKTTIIIIQIKLNNIKKYNQLL